MRHRSENVFNCVNSLIDHHFGERLIVVISVTSMASAAAGHNDLKRETQNLNNGDTVIIQKLDTYIQETSETQTFNCLLNVVYFNQLLGAVRT